MAEALLISRIPVRYRNLLDLDAALSSHPQVDFRQLSRLFVPNPEGLYSKNSALLKEMLSFLCALGKLEFQGGPTWEERVFRRVPSSLSFRLDVLHRLHTHPDPRQRAFMGVWDTLVEEDLFCVSVGEVIERMEQSKHQGFFAWNDTKINFWAQFLFDLGLLVRVPPLRLAVSPMSDLLLELIPQGIHPAGVLLEGWNASYFRVFTGRRELHVGVARGLLRLEEAEKVRLSYQSDAVHMVNVLGRHVSVVERA